MIRIKILWLMKNKFYIIFFDLKLNSSSFQYPANVDAIIEGLRLDYFRNRSMKISDKTLLIATEDDIIDTYPNIDSWIEEIIISLSDEKGFIAVEFEAIEWHIFKPDEKKINELKDRFLEVGLYLEI